MASEIDDETSDIPEYIYDAKCHKTYKRIKIYGKGSFGECYKIVDAMTNRSFAGKIISKKLAMKLNQKEKLTQEITIHRSLNHPNIVKFHSFFEDSFNIYIVLELCKKRSMNELQRRRQTITDYECRYYMHQIINGVKYLHENHIIHRDLKLGNLFLNDLLHVKIGDFGVATRIEHDGERRKTICGTPNFIAPEILTEMGHSYEVDIWSIGCVMYTLLVGEPPFIMNTIKDTCEKIKKCEYLIPNVLSKSAADMITAMLQLNPEHRPTIAELLSFDFLSSDSVPKFLPTSCLTMAPRMEHNDTMVIEAANRKPFTGINCIKNDASLETTFLRNNLHDDILVAARSYRFNVEYCSDIQSVIQQIANLLNANPPLLPDNLVDENTDSAAQPLFWICNWLDYSDKYGFGYQMCDESVGVVFNDGTKLISLPNQINVHYIDKEGIESYMTTEDYSKTLNKKMVLLRYFKRYMTENLAKVGANNVKFKSDLISRMPHLHFWCKTRCAVIMLLTNGTVQLNFNDHIKIILCPCMSAVTYIDFKRNLHTYRFSAILQHGWSIDLYQKILYAHEKLSEILALMCF